MLKSCPYCGRIHDSRMICAAKHAAIAGRQHKRGTQEDKVHSSYRWTQLSRSIRDRDHYMCQACLHSLDGKGSRITSDGLEVHHIIPIDEAWDLRSDRENLITLCRYHHEQAECGKISRKSLKEIAKQNEDKTD